MKLLLYLLALLCCLAARPAAAEKRIAFSFDDVPRRPGGFMNVEERTTRLLAGLRRSGIRQAAFFLNPAISRKPGASAARRGSRATSAPAMSSPTTASAIRR